MGRAAGDSGMSSDFYQAESEGKRPRSLLTLLIVPLVAFLAGIGAMGWLLVNWDDAARVIGVKPAPPPTAPTIVPVRPIVTVAPVPAGGPGGTPLVIDPEMGRRMAQLEQRIAQIDTQARSAVGNADRAEGLLVAFAARRALDRGVGLGYLEGLLRQRFSATQAQAVATIITASRHPVTLQELQEGLQKVAPELAGGGPNQSWWNALRTELGGLVMIRKEGTPSPMPVERLTRATRRLEAGQVDVALAEVLRMPARQEASEWISAARQYVAARRALDAIETAALLEPRGQLAPVSG